ncbi:MAG: cobyrinate a,c-diamide synthase [Bacteroidales bacterium]
MEPLLSRALPRLVIAGLSGDSGKTLVTVGLTLAVRARHMSVCAFKKGPDYIDAAWLAWASEGAARNLDTHMMDGELVRSTFVERGTTSGINIVEGNRGLFDGSDARGTHSTAQIAKLLDAPIVLVVDCAKVTRTAAACVLGCQALDPDARLAGVILNRVAGDRHERILREAIENAGDVPVLGAWRRADGALLPGRHLGLVPPAELPPVHELKTKLTALAESSLDIPRLVELARQQRPVEASPFPHQTRAPGPPVKVGYLHDSAFTFYYPENLEALEAAGGALVALSGLEAAPFPADLSALYIGGGFPETHAAALAANTGFLAALKRAADAGLPIYAECGGLMLLSQAIWWQGRRYPMAGVLPFEVEMHARPQGHGYVQMVVDQPNAFFAEGTAIKGHEFHYSSVGAGADSVPTAAALGRGTGALAGRDAFVVKQTWASYTHLHATAMPQWAPGVIAAARRFRRPSPRDQV